MRAFVKQGALLAAALWLAGCSTPPAATPSAQAPAAPGVAASAPVVSAPPLPYSEAVAARFPDPTASYDTPGLQPMRDAFTSNAELSSALHRLAATSSPDFTSIAETYWLLLAWRNT